MFSISVIVSVSLYLTTLVGSNDIVIGHANPFSRKIYSAIKTADPALWQRTDDIMISAPYNDYISAVYVTDLRPDKEGEAYLAAGGIGSKTVTISLKSPSILRGYKFAIEVYAENIHSYFASMRSSVGLSGVGSYPSTYPVSGVSYSVGNGQYPGSGYSQYPIVG